MFESVTTLLNPDYIKIKARFFPVITIDPKKESPLANFFQPTVYLIKGDNIVKLDPITKTIHSATSQELKQTGMTIIDFVMFGAVIILLFTGLGVYLKKKSKIK